MSRCFIFGALPVDRLTVKLEEGDMIIAADKGYDTVKALGLKPDLTVGDFDSRGNAPDDDHVITLNVRKDMTDVGYAADKGFAQGYTSFVIYGCVGGLLDHTLANIAIAHDIAVRGGSSVFIGEDMCFTVIRDGTKDFDDTCRGRLSVFALGGTAHGVRLKGLSYELDGVDLPCTSHIGVSNEFIGQPAQASVDDGALLIVWQTKG